MNNDFNWNDYLANSFRVKKDSFTSYFAPELEEDRIKEEAARKTIAFLCGDSSNWEQVSLPNELLKILKEEN